jgi:hypothetical protein
MVTVRTTAVSTRAPDDTDEGPDPPDDRVTVSIRFPGALARELRALAREQNRSFNGTVREACRRYVRAMRPRVQREDG